MMNSANKTVAVSEALSGLEVDMVGVARLEDIRESRLEEQVLKLLPSARSVVAVGMEIWPEFLDFTTPEMTAGTANPNDLLERHKEYLRGRLARAVYDVANASREAGFKAIPLQARGPSIDHRTLAAVISYKHAAEAAGLGRIGMSSLLLTEKYGPRVQLAICLTEAGLEPTPVLEEDVCRYCNICISKCPSGALKYTRKEENRYLINVFTCREYVEASGGCSECMKQCPVASPRYG